MASTENRAPSAANANGVSSIIILYMLACFDDSVMSVCIFLSFISRVPALHESVGL